MTKQYLLLFPLLLLGCDVSTSKYAASNTLYYHEFYIEVGELTPDKIQNGILNVEGQWTDKQKERLKTFWKEKSDLNRYNLIVQAYLEHEDFLGKDIRPGEPIYNHDDYICSQAKLFFEPDYRQDGKPIAIGNIQSYTSKKRQYLNFTEVELEPFDNPAAFPLKTALVITEDLEKQYILDANYKLRLQIGTSITESNRPKERFYIRLVVRVAPDTENYTLKAGPPPRCGPYSNIKTMPDMDMTEDMATNPTDMPQDITSDSPDMPIDQPSPDMPLDIQSDLSQPDLTSADMTQD